MSESCPPPPYEEPEKASGNQNSNPQWQTWYRKFIALKFNQDEAVEYAKLFINNEIDISMIPELNDGVLRSMGIEKAGHRIRILRLQAKPPATAAAAAAPPPSTRSIAPPVMSAPHCAWHPQVVAVEKCRKCQRLVCLNCRRSKASDGGTRYFCQNCYDDCTIL